MYYKLHPIINLLEKIDTALPVFENVYEDSVSQPQVRHPNLSRAVILKVGIAEKLMTHGTVCFSTRTQHIHRGGPLNFISAKDRGPKRNTDLRHKKVVNT